MNQRRIFQFVSIVLLVIMAIALVPPQSAQANWSTCQSIKDGNWDDYSTWSCSSNTGTNVPSDHTNVYIYNVVTIGSNHSSTGSWAGAGSLYNNGKLIMNGGLIVWGPTATNNSVGTYNYLGGIYEGYGGISFIQGQNYTAASRDIYTGSWGNGYAPRIGCGDQYYYNWGDITCNISGNFQTISNTQPDYVARGNMVVVGNTTLYDNWYQSAGTINFNPGVTLELAGTTGSGPWTYWNTSNAVEIPNAVVTGTNGWNIPPSLRRIYNYTNYSNGITKFNWGSKWSDFQIDSFNNYNSGQFDYSGLSGASLTIGNLYNAPTAWLYSTNQTGFPLNLYGQINNTNTNNSNILRKINVTGGGDQNLFFGGWSAIFGFDVNKPSGRAILNNNLYVQGNVDVTSGILDLGPYTLSASNTALTVQNGAGYYVSGASGLQYAGFNSTNFSSGCTLGLTGTASREASLTGTNCYNLYLAGGPKTMSANLNVPGYLWIDSGASLSLGSKNLTVGNYLQVNGGTLHGGTGVITTPKLFQVGTFNPGTGTLMLTGASGSLISSGPLNLNNLTINGGANITGPLNGTINVAGDWVNNGSFTPNGSTVNLTGTNQIIAGVNTFFNLTKNSGAAAILSFPAGKKQTITGALNLSGGSSSSRLALRSSTAGTPWQLDAQGTRSLLNLDVRDSNNVNAAAMAAPTTNGNLDNGNNTNWNFVPTTVTSLGAPAAKTYKIGDTLDFTVNFTNIVTVAGATTPRLGLTVGSSTLYANYFSGSGSKNIVFRYTVTSGDLDIDGIVLGTLGLNGGTMTDNASAPADLTLNNVASTALVKVDGVAPAVSSVTLPANKTYGLGDVLDFSVIFSEPVTLSGAPQLPLTVGASPKTASYLSGSGTDTVIFRYIVGATDVDADGITLSALSLNGGSILDAAGNPSALALNGVPSAAGVQVDGTGPVTSSVAVPSNGTYKIGDTLDFTVNWNKNVAVAGTPRLALTVGSGTKYATYLSGTGSNALVFRYTVDEGDLDSNGIDIAALQLNNGTLQDATLGNAANLGLNSVALTTGVKVDGVRAAVTAVGGPSGVTLSTDAELNFTVTWSEPVTVDFSGGTPRLTLNIDFTDKLANPTPIRYAEYLSGTGTNTLIFRYTILAGEDGTLTNTDSNIDLNSGTVKDGAGNNANLTMEAYSGDGVLIDTTPPSILSVNAPLPGSYKPTDILTFTVNWSEKVAVTGIPRLVLTIGANTRYATYSAGSDTTALTFTYTVAADDANGLTVDSMDLNTGINTGTITDYASPTANNAILTLHNTDITSGIITDSTAPIVSAITRVSSTPTLASSVQFEVKFSEPVSGLSASNFGFSAIGLGGTPVVDSITGSGDTYTVDVTGYTGSGTLGLNKSVNTGVIDLAGNALASSANDTGAVFTIDNQAPTLSTIDLPAAKTYTTKSGNDTLTFTLNWNETVHVDTTSGTPRLALSVGAATRYAAYQSGSDSSALTFTYTVNSADQATGGITIAELQLNGGSITDVAGNPAFLTLPAADASGVKVQGTFALTLLTGGGGMGDLTVIPNQATFSDGDSVTLTATPLSNSLYVGASSLTWTPDNVTTPTYYTTTLTMTAGTSITVYFEIKGAAYVDATYDSSTPGWGITRFASIQTAIDTVAAGTLLNVSGTYTENVNLNKNLNLVLLNNTVINGSISQSDGTLDMPGGTLTLNGSISKTAGTFNANGGTLKLTGPSPSLSEGLSLANLEMAGSGTLTSGAVTLSGDLTLTSGAFSPADGTLLKNVTIASGATLNAPAGTLSVGGNWTNNGTFNGNGGTLVFNGSGDQSLGGSSALSFSALQIASAGKVTTSKALTVSGQLTVNSGTIDPYNGSSFGSLTVGQAGEFTLSSGATVSVTDAVNNAGAFAPAGGTLNVGGLFTNSGSYAQTGGTVNANAGFSNSGTFAQDGGSLAVTGAFDNTGSFAQKSGSLTVTGAFSNGASASYLQTGGATSAASLTNSGSFAQSGGTLDLSGDFDNTGTYAQSGTGTVTVGGNFSESGAGSFNASSGTLNLKGNLSHSGTGTFNASGGLVAFNGSSAQTMSGPLTFANLTLDNAAGVSMPSGTLSVAQDFNLSQGGFSAPTGAAFNNLVLATGTTFDAPAGSMNVSGNFTRSGTAVFNANGGTVVFDGSGTQTISGAVNFYNLSVNQSAGSLLTSDAALTVANTTTITSGALKPFTGSSFKDLLIASGATLDGSLGTLNVAGNLSNDGSFVPGSGQVNFNGSGTQTLSGTSATSFYDLTVASGSALVVNSVVPLTPAPSVTHNTLLNGDFTPINGTSLTNLSIALGGTLNAPSGTLNIAGDWDNLGTFNPNAGTVNFNGGVAQAITGTAGHNAFANLSINNSATSPDAVSTSPAISASGSLNISQGEFQPASGSAFKNIDIANGAVLTAPTGDLAVSGSWVNNGTFTPGTGSVTFNGSGAQTISGTSATSFYDLNVAAGAILGVDAASPALTVTNNTAVSGTFAPPSASQLKNLSVALGGTLNAPSGTLNVSGDWANLGTLNPNAGTVNFNGSAAQAITGTAGHNAFANLSINNTATSPDAVSTSPAISASGDLAVSQGNFKPASGSAFNNIDIASGAVLTAPTGDLAVSGNWVNNGTFTPGTGSVTFDGSGAQSISGSTVSDFNTLTVNKTSGTLSASTAMTVSGTTDIKSGAFSPATNSSFAAVSIANGASLNASAGNLNISGDWANDGTFNPNASGSLTFNGSAPQVIGGAAASAFSNLIVNNPTSVGFNPLTPAPSVSGVLDLQQGNFSPPSGSNLHTVLIEGTATLTAPAGNLNVSGDWTNLGSFVPGTSGTVTFNGSGAQSLSGNTAFNNLALGASSVLQPAKNVNISLDGDLSVATGGQFDTATNLPNTLTVTGANSHITSGTTLSNLVIASGAKLTAPAQLNLLGDWTNQGAFDANGGNVTFNGSSAQVLSGNTAFNNLSVGASSILQPAKDVNISLGGDLSVAAGGQFDTTTNLPNTLTVTGADSHIPNGTTLSNLVIGSGAKLTGPAALSLLGDWTNNGSFAANGGKVTFDGAGAQQIAGSSTTTFQDLTINKSSGTLSSLTSLNVLGQTDVQKGGFSPASGSALTNLLIESLGTLNAPTGDLAVSGNWSNNGSFNPGSSGSVTFNGGAAQQIGGSAANSFHNLIVNKASGTLNTSTAVTVANLLDVKKGTFSPASGSDFANVKIETGATLTAPTGNLTVSGGWDNQGSFTPGTGSVTFDGSSTQAISGTANFNALVLDNPTSVTSVQPLSVAQTFTLAQGAFNPPSNSQFHTLNIVSGSTFSLDAADTLNVSGDFNNNGSFSPAAGSTTVFNGTTNQAISGAATNFSNLVINNNGAKVTGNVPVHVSGTTTITKGTFDPADASTFDALSIGSLGALTSTSGETITITHDLVNNGTFTSTGGTLNLGGSFYNQGSYSTNGGTTNITGNLLNSGSYVAALGDLNLGGNLSNTGTFNPGGGTVTFDGTTPQTISGSGISFASLVLNNPAGVSADNAITVKNTLEIAKGSFNPPTGSQFHDLLIDGAGTLTLDSTDRVMVSGDFTNNGAFKPANGSTVVMDGSTAQVIGGSSLVNFKNLEINNTATAPGGVTSSRDILVSGTTTLVDGIFAPADGSMLNIVNIQPNGVFEVHSPSAITITNNLTNNGTFNQDGGSIDLWGSFINKRVFNPTGGTLDISGDFTNTTGATFAPQSGTINVTGDFNNAGVFAPQGGLLSLLSNFSNTGSMAPQGGTVEMVGTKAQQITGNPATFANLVFNNSVGVSATAALTVTDAFNLAQGSFNPPSGSQLNDLTVALGAALNLDPTDRLSISGDIQNNGTINPNGGTMVLDGSTAQAILGNAFTFGNLEINNSGSAPITSAFPLVVSGLLNLKDGTLDLPIGSDLNDVTVASGANLDGSAGNITVSGDWNNQGNFTPGGNTVTFDGTGPQQILGSTDFNDLIVGATSTLQMGANANLGLLGSLDILSGGAFDSTSHEPNTLTIFGAGPHDLPNGLQLDNLVVAKGATFVPPASLLVAGDFTNNGTFTPNGGTITLDGTGPQTIGGTSPTTFDNLVIDNSSPSATVQSTGPVIVTGGLDIQDGAFAPAAGSNLNDVTIASGASLDGPTGNLGVSGDWINNGTFVPEPGSTVIFDGSLPQIIGGTSPTVFDTLVIDNASGQPVTTSTPVTVTGPTDIIGGSLEPQPGSTFGDVTIEPGSTLIIPPAGGLTIEGTLTNNNPSNVLRTLSLTPGGDGSGTFTTTPSGNTFNDGQVVAVTAIPSRGSSFGSWTGSLIGTTNPQSLTMNSSHSATAVFTLNSYQLTILTGGNGLGTVTSDLIGPSYKFGTVVSLTPHAGTRSIFSGWSGAASGSTNPLSLKIEDNTTLTANFSLSTVLLSGNTGIGGVTLTITNAAAAQSTLGGNMTVVSDADGNFAFEVPYNWSGRVTLSKTKYTFDPAYLDFTNVQTDQKTQQIIAHEIFYSYMPLIQNLNKEMIVYQQDFSSNVGAEWSSTSTSTSPTGQKFLGEFVNNSIQLHLSNLPAHNVVTVSFDLYLLRSWDGNSTNQGPDVWLLNADNKTLLNTTFSNNLENQSYPGATSIGNYPFQTGASKVNSLGYYFLLAPMDSIYHLSYTLDHTDAAMLLAFQASGLQNMSDESWGLDNIVITTQLK